MKKIQNSSFLTSCTKLKDCPQYGLPEIALIGRSNVGKSSFINALCNRKNLAHTSNTPGKTRLINFYDIDNWVIIADLPGYGYAKVSKTEQNKWKATLEEYLLQRENLICVIQFIDSRHEVQNNDIQMREWLNHNGFKIITVATKIDTLKKSEINKSLSLISSTLECKVTEFSAKSAAGKHKAIAEISTMIELAKNNPKN